MDVDLTYTIVPVACLEGHTERAWYLAWNPQRPLLASCSADKNVRLYSYTNASLSSVTPPENGDSKSRPTEELKFTHAATINTEHLKTVRGVAWAPSGKTLATASFDSNVGIWEQDEEDGDAEDGNGAAGAGEWECVGTLEGHESECKSVAYSASGTLLASCSRDKMVWVWEVHPDSEFECMGVLMEHTQDVKCVAWHPHEEILASGSYDNTIKLHIDDPSDDWFCFATLEGHTSTVWSIAWSPCGKYLASCSDDRTVRIWVNMGSRPGPGSVLANGSQGRWIQGVVLEVGERSLYSVTWGKGKSREAEGRLGWLAVTGGDGVINVWEISEPLKTTDPGASLKDVALSAVAPRHKLIASLPDSHGVDDVNCIAWCPREGYEDLLATTGDDMATRVWKVVPTARQP